MYFGRFHHRPARQLQHGYMLIVVIFLMVVAAAEVGLALAIIISLNRTSDISAIDSINRLRG